jgi:hypothetical protein
MRMEVLVTRCRDEEGGEQVRARYFAAAVGQLLHKVYGRFIGTPTENAE